MFIVQKIRCLAASLSICVLTVHPTSLLADPTMIVDPSMSAATTSEFQSAFSTALDDYRRYLGYEFPSSVVAVVSDRPEFVARQYADRRNANYAQKLQSFQQWIYGEATYRGIYYNLSNREYNNRADTTVRQNRIRSINHELFHILQYELVGTRSRNCCVPDRVPSVGPIWLMEGSASYFARVIGGERINDYIRFSRGQVRNLGGRNLDFLEIRRGMNEIQNGYEISAYATHLLVEQNGANSVIQFYQLLGQTGNWQSSFEAAFGQTPQQFYATFR